MVKVYPSKKLGSVVLLHDYITLRNEKTELEKEVEKWKEVCKKSESEAARYSKELSELREENKKLKEHARDNFYLPKSDMQINPLVCPLIEELKGCQLLNIELKSIKEALGKGDVPRFRIQVTPEQSEYVQKWIFAHGGQWDKKFCHCIESKNVLYLEQKYLFIDLEKNMTTSDNKLDIFVTSDKPCITFDQFKAWAKPIEPEKKASDFPLLVVIEHNGEKYIGYRDQTFDIPGTNITRVYFWDKYSNMQSTGLWRPEEHGCSDARRNAEIKVTKTTIDKIKRGDLS